MPKSAANKRYFMSTSTVIPCPNCGANNRNSASRCEFCDTMLDSTRRPELVEKSLSVLLSSAEKQLKAGNRKIDALYASSFGVPLLTMVASIMWGPGPWIGLLLAFVLFFAFVMMASSVESREQQHMFDDDIRRRNCLRLSTNIISARKNCLHRHTIRLARILTYANLSADCDINQKPKNNNTMAASRDSFSARLHSATCWQACLG